MTNQVLILYTYFKKDLANKPYHKYLVNLPDFISQPILAYFKHEDQVASILGKQLLLTGLKQLGFDQSLIHTLQYKENNRPFVSALPQLDFNISHSDNLVICAFSLHAKIGVDIEKRNPINILTFKDQMSDSQWEEILSADDPDQQFYKYWVQKEALVKADGIGLSHPLASIDIQFQTSFINNQRWLLTPLNIDKAYCCWLASNKKITLEMK